MKKGYGISKGVFFVKLLGRGRPVVLVIPSAPPALAMPMLYVLHVIISADDKQKTETMSPAAIKPIAPEAKEQAAVCVRRAAKNGMPMLFLIICHCINVCTMYVLYV